MYTEQHFNENSMFEGSKASRLGASAYCLRHLERARSRGDGAFSPQRRAVAFAGNSHARNRSRRSAAMFEHVRADFVAVQFAEYARTAGPEDALDRAAHARRRKIRQF